MKLFAALAVFALSFSANATVNMVKAQRQMLTQQGLSAVSMLEGKLGRSLSGEEIASFTNGEDATRRSLMTASVGAGDGLQTTRLYCLKVDIIIAGDFDGAICAGESGLHSVYGTGGFGLGATLSGAVLVLHLPGDAPISQTFSHPVGLSVAYFGGIQAIRFRDASESAGYLDVFAISAGFGGALHLGDKDRVGLKID